MTSRVTLVSRAGCHLCAEAMAMLDRLGVEYEVADVDARADWQAEWGDLVPVVLLDGKQVDWGRLDEKRLAKVLARPRGWRPW